MTINAPAHLIQTWNQLYFERLGYKPKGKPSLDQLNALIKAHQTNIPFENLDIQLGNPLDLSLPVLRKKILHDGRGGFCYELNHLFASFLKHLGYRVQLISAQVMDQNGRLGREYDHLALLVQVNDQQHLVDVGFGKFAAQALPLTDGISCIHYEDHEAYQIELNGSFGVVSFQSENEGMKSKFKTLYTFTTEAKVIEDFFGMFGYHQSSEFSPFVKGLLTSIRAKDGRVSISKNKLILSKGSEKRIQTLATPKEFQNILLHHFNLSITESDAARLSSGKR